MRRRKKGSLDFKTNSSLCGRFPLRELRAALSAFIQRH